MIWNRTGSSFAAMVRVLFVALTCFGSHPALSESPSVGQAWKSCQSPDADKRLVGCTAVINDKGGGSRSKLSDALDGRCWAYHVKGQYDLAIADCKASIAIRPNYPYSYNNLGTAYLGIGDFPNAIIVLSRAIELKPNFVFSRLNRARAYVAVGKRDEALRDYQAALVLEPENGEAKEAFRAMLSGPVGANPTLVVAGNNRPVAQADASIQQAVPSLGNHPESTSLLSSPVSPSPSVSLKPTAAFGRRIALVIGNANYKNAPVLANPRRDAELIAEVLKRTGFQTVTLQNDLGRDALIAALRLFASQAETADWSLVYYSGHGMEIGGVNYLIPVDAKIVSDRDIGLEAVSLNQVLSAAERSKMLRLVMLDACRDNPFANQMKRTLNVASRSVSRGLASIEPDAGTLVVYAAKDGEVALDGDGLNSPFAAAFVKNLQTPGLEVRRMFDFVRDDVMDATGRKQRPFSYGSISGRQDFYFVTAK